MTKETSAQADTESKALVAGGAASLPAELQGMMDEDAGRGVSNNANDVGIPYLGILQDLSPQVKTRDEAYIDGASPGMVFNNQTKQIFAGKDGVLFIPCYFRSAMVEWKPNRGGWVAEHPMDTPLRRQVQMVDNGQGKMEPRLPNGNLLVETKYYYGFYMDPDTGAFEPAVIGMSSSMLKCSRDWQGLLKRVKTPGGATAPSYAKVYRLRSKLVQKNNNEWFVWDIVEERWVNSEEYAIGRTLYEQVEAGAVQASRPDEAEATGGVGDAAEEVL